MNSFFGTVLGWLATATSRASNADGAQGFGLSDYDRHLRELEERSGRLFLP